MKWISVKEKMPEDWQSVLTYWAKERQIQLQTYIEKDGPGGISWWIGGWQNLAVEDGAVTYWMPLPAGPE